MNSSLLHRWSPLILLLLTLVLWQGICSLFHVSEFIFPSPWRIVEQTWEHRGTILGHAWRTFWVTMIGFGIAIVVGVLLGFLMGSSRLAYDAMYPLMTGFNECSAPSAGTCSSRWACRDRCPTSTAA
jgi:NitT/TauT family transport system permease protein